MSFAPAPSPPAATAQPRVWRVAQLVRAMADALEARFNPVTVQGELSGFTRAASGHFYFIIKDDADDAGLRCAMFKRAASLVQHQPRDGDAVELRGRLAVYAPRGELQLVVEHMRRAGQGTLWEQFEKLKAQLAFEGWFEAGRKRPLPTFVRRVALITSLQAAALRDVTAALARRAPHVQAIVLPASVQGTNAPQEIVAALQKVELPAQILRHFSVFLPSNERTERVAVDAVLLVRGGGSMEDLWAFNDAAVVRAVGSCPVPVICGVGHETDFTLADFAADLRAPTPTAAAELLSTPTEALLARLQDVQDGLTSAAFGRLESEGQRVDTLTQALARPNLLLHRKRLQLAALEQRLPQVLLSKTQLSAQVLRQLSVFLPQKMGWRLQRENLRLEALAGRLSALDPSLVLQRGYAWLELEGRAITSVKQLQPGRKVTAVLADGSAQLQVSAVLPAG